MVKIEVFDTFSKEKYRKCENRVILPLIFSTIPFKNMVKIEVFDTFSKEKYRKC